MALTKQWLNLAPTLRARFQKLVFPQGITYDRETGFGNVVLGRIFNLNYQHTLTKSPLVDPPGVEPGPVPCHGTVLPLYYRPVRKRLQLTARCAARKTLRRIDSAVSDLHPYITHILKFYVGNRILPVGNICRNALDVVNINAASLQKDEKYEHRRIERSHIGERRAQFELDVVSYGIF